VRYLLDTNILSGLVRVPRGPLAQKIAEIGEANVYTSIVVAAGIPIRRGQTRIGAIVPAGRDGAWGHRHRPVHGSGRSRVREVRRHLERIGQPIGANDLLIASHALCDASIIVTDNVGEFSRVPGLRVENWLER